jgi:hypothetical protein
MPGGPPASAKAADTTASPALLPLRYPSHPRNRGEKSSVAAIFFVTQRKIFGRNR